MNRERNKTKKDDVRLKFKNIAWQNKEDNDTNSYNVPKKKYKKELLYSKNLCIKAQ